MFGKTRTAEARQKIAERSRWKDPEGKRQMKVKGMLRHFSRVSVEDIPTMDKYINGILSNTKCKRPAFINAAYTLSIQKIIDLFGTVDAFNSEMRNLGYVITQGESQL
jgi:hypothetical protein